jgi:hypothetical protein
MNRPRFSSLADAIRAGFQIDLQPGMGAGLEDGRILVRQRAGAGWLYADVQMRPRRGAPEL